MFHFGEFRLDVSQRRFARGSSEIPLPPKAFDLLALFVSRSGELLSKEALLRELWPDTFVDEGVLSVYVSTLRKALGETAGTSTFIETLPKKGYRFIGSVAEEKSPAPSLAPAPSRLAIIAAIALAAVTLIGGSWALARRQELAQYKLEMSRPVTSSPGVVSQPALSPDGGTVAYVWERFDGAPMSIYLQRGTESGRTQLTTDPGYSLAPTWSPDGRQIAFLYGTSDGGQVDVMLTDPQHPTSRHKLTSVGRFISSQYPLPSLDWSPDGRYLLGSDTTSGSHFPSLVAISVASGHKTFLTSAPSHSADIDGRYSWDGKWIAFRRCIGSSVDDVYLLPASGGKPQRLTYDFRRIRGMAWSSEGRSLIVASNRTSALTSLWRVFVNRQPAVELTTPVVHASGPAVARRAKRLAFVSEVNDVNIWKRAINETGSPLEVIGSTYLDTSPDISPDGSQIVFRSDRGGSNEIWISDSSGHNPRQLTHFGGPVTGCPRWSPDGRWVTFDSRASGSAQIYKLRLDDDTLMRLTSFDSDNVVPSWSHDGHFIYFSSNRTGSEQLWKISANGGAEQQLTTTGGFAGVESADGQTIYYVKDLGQTSIWRMPVDGGQPAEVIAAIGPRLWGYWALSAHYLTFLRLASPDAENAEILQLDLATRKVRHVGTTDHAIESGTKGFSVSKDEQWMFYSQHDVYQTSIMLAN